MTYIQTHLRVSLLAFVVLAVLAGCEEAAEKAPQQGTKGPAWIGAAFKDVSGSDVKKLKLKNAKGVHIVKVKSGGPSAKAGLKPNDVVIVYDGKKVTGAKQFRRMLRSSEVGKEVIVTVSRGGEIKKLDLVPIKKP